MLAVAISPVAGLAGLVGLGVHDLVDERLGHDNLRRVGHRAWLADKRGNIDGSIKALDFHSEASRRKSAPI